MKNMSSVSKWPFQHTKMAILRKWGYVLKWQFWGNWGMVANSANIGAFYTILTNIWHPWWSWVRLHMEVQLVLWEKFESNLLVCSIRDPSPRDFSIMTLHGSVCLVILNANIFLHSIHIFNAKYYMLSRNLSLNSEVVPLKPENPLMKNNHSQL